MTEQGTEADKTRRRQRLTLRLGAIVQIAVEDDKIRPAEVIAILMGEVERLRRLLPS